MTEEKIEDQPDRPQRKRVPTDPEVAAMKRIDRILFNLPTERARARICGWVADKINFPLIDLRSQEEL